MAQAFVTSYRNHYRWNKEKLRKTKKSVDRHAEIPPPGDYWIKLKSRKDGALEGASNLEHAEALVKENQVRKLFTTYHMNYCKDFVARKNKELAEAVNKAAGNVGKKKEEQSFENELLKYCTELYSPNTQKLMPPLPTARRVHGFIRPEGMYTPLTTYQQTHGKTGYDILSNPLEYLNRSKDEDEDMTFPVRVPAETMKLNIVTRQDVSRLSNRLERMERDEKLKEILETVDRAKIYVDDVCCPCF